jgi:cytochrome c553
MPASKFRSAVPVLLAGAASLAFAQGAAPAKAAQCFACHGSDGMAKMPDAPNLAGQNEGYLVKALHDFKAGRRENMPHGALACACRPILRDATVWAGSHAPGLQFTMGSEALSPVTFTLTGMRVW